MQSDNKMLLQNLFKAAYQSCLAEQAMPEHLANIQYSDKVCIIGAGKAAAEMAAAAHAFFGEACYGTVVTRYGYETEKDTGAIEVLTAGHPSPDQNSLFAGQKLLDLVKQTPSDVPVVFLISGGGSALACLPVEGLEFSEKLAVHQFLVKSGASITEINTVRKHLSALKGGKLAAACQSSMTSLILSDVVGDDMSVIASGPTVIDHTTAQQALDILIKYQYPVSDKLEQILSRDTSVDTQYSHNTQNSTQNVIIANANVAIDTAAKQAHQLGIKTHILSYDIEGDAQQVAKEHAAIALEYKRKGERILLLSGGEMTVKAQNATGDGGPNQEYMLTMAMELNNTPGICAISCDTDGVDGSQDVAGAFIDESTLTRAKQLGLEPRTYLNTHDSYHFFKQLDDLIITGPTNTNVNDFRAIYVNGMAD
ncbi:glycerate kinase type-2 family protein [Catenovulum sediminis]|uniref:DUF4147 domain-containing protein n=1 Tax=Catenovulum sediminis TaxID=1740262 RepID=A0ABV1RDF1_9ALTE